jgi:DNA-binding MarR family transcriptional regulator
MVAEDQSRERLPLPSRGKHPDVCRPIGLELENVDELTARVFHAFGRMVHLNRLVMGRMIAQRGAHHGEVIALALLRHHDGISQRELGQILHLSAPRVSAILDALERGGAVDRRSDEVDRRLTRVYLTAEGRERERQQRDLLSDYVNRTVGALSEVDRSELERILGELADRTMTVLHQAKPGGKHDEPEGEA